MNILVTGCYGQLGRHIRLLAAASQHRYFFTDIMLEDGDSDAAELDITRRDAVMNFVLHNGINCVINCAAYTNVDKAEEEEEVADKVNNQAVGFLADAMKVQGGELVHVSTDYVFGGNSHNKPCGEDAQEGPTGAYGRTKLAGEKAVLASGCHYLLVRTGWLYSEFGKNFLKTMLRVMPTHDEIKVVFDQVGTPTYAGDLARAVFDIVEHEQFRGNDGIYHFSNEGVCSWYDFAMAIRRMGWRVYGMVAMQNCHIQPCHSCDYPSPVVRPPYSVLDKTKIKHTFGVHIPYWEESLERCMSNIMSPNGTTM